MKKPEQKWISVTEIDVGTELAHPSYVEWADERIKVLEDTIENFFNRFHSYDPEKDDLEKDVDLLKDIRDDLR